MDVMVRLRNSGVVPVVVIEEAGCAVSAANALLQGGVDVMEITLRTGTAIEAIKLVAEECPDICIGAGTVLSEDQGKAAVDAGAKFIVSPGFDTNLVEWCVNNGVPITPGCVTPTDIMAAIHYQLRILKFFPANVFGGLIAMKALASPFGNISFIPTGGISSANLAEYMGLPFIHAVGGSWLCPKGHITDGRFEDISELCRLARNQVLGYECFCVGSYPKSNQELIEAREDLKAVFGVELNISKNDVPPAQTIGVPRPGDVADQVDFVVFTHDLERATADLVRRGYEVELDVIEFAGREMNALKVKNAIGNNTIHIMKR